jgi:hypothetical protein
MFGLGVQPWQCYASHDLPSPKSVALRGDEVVGPTQ